MRRRVHRHGKAPMRKGSIASHPLSGTCPLCDKPLGSVELLKRPSGWVHKSCWMTEKGE